MMSSEELTDEGRRGPAGDDDHDHVHPEELTEMTDLMAETYDVRHQDVLENNLSVKNALALYPALRDFEELRREFERITEKSVSDFERHLSCVLKQFAENQIARGSSTSCTSTYCKESLEVLGGGETDNTGLTAARVILFACAQSENAWMDVVFKVIRENGEIRIGRLQPTVLVNGSPFGEKCADVYCEKIKVVGDVNFYEAVLTCYFLYYIFNIDFPRVDREIFKPFDHVLSLMAEED